MTGWKVIALITICVCVIAGALIGVFQPTDAPPKQKYSFSDEAVWSKTPVSCPPSPGNWSIWLEINVLGNRTGLNLQRVTVFGQVKEVQLPLALNETVYVAYRPINSSFENVFVPLPTYWNVGDALQVSVSFFFTGFAPITDSLPQTILDPGNVTC